MITKIKVSNYRSLGPATVIDFDRMTVFVGQNGSGKSNVVDIIRFISDIMRMGLDGALTKRNGIKAVRRWSSGKPLNIHLELELVENSFSGSYSFEIASDKNYDYIVKNEMANIKTPEDTFFYLVNNQKWIQGPDGLKPTISPTNLALPLIAGDDRFKPLVDSMRNMEIYNISPENLRRPQGYDPNKPMNENGLNWLSILKDQPADTWKPDLIPALSQLTDDIDDIDIKQISGYLIAKFKHGTTGQSNKAKWFDSSQESDGTLRIAGIISALVQTPPLSVVGIEEPELTIHPGAIPLLMDFFNQAKDHSQILITTHSPELLDCINDSENIRVVRRGKGITSVKKMEKDQINAVKNGLFSLGELHRIEGLQGEQTSIEFP
ncbi:MAG: AAA family ATPase [Bacteroidales bacterium]|nr:AAA family ATPase [Bacteroidales bacterium]